MLAGAITAALFIASPAYAQSTNVSPSSDVVGSTVHITGSGFIPGDNYEIFFAEDTAYEITRSGVVAVDGTISRFLTVPEMPGETYTVTIEDSVNSDSDSFTVEPNMGLNRSSVEVGDLVSVQGNGFRDDRSVSIRLDGRTVERTSTDSNGTFQETFRVPEAERGTHEVTADDGFYEVDDEVLVVQSLYIDPESGTTGTEVEVTGYGFRDDRTITIFFDSEEVDTDPDTVRTNDYGSFEATFKVPVCFNREVEVEASDGYYVEAEDFEVLASISLGTSSGKVGDSINVQGTGFRGNRDIDIILNDVEVDTEPDRVRTNSSGCFTAEFIVPEIPGGDHEINASDGVESAEADFSILSDITISPRSGTIGESVDITGTGFRDDQTITLRFNGRHVGTTASDNQGSFDHSFMVPAFSSGNYDISATDGVNSADATFTITVSFELQPVEGHVGSMAAVSGSGFTGPVTVKYDDEVVATVTADNDGNFTATFSIPQSIHGHHTVTASDNINTVEEVFTMESTPPPVPSPITPEEGRRQDSQPTLDWQTVTDPSGVTYKLQIATGPNFTNIVLEKGGLTESTYSLASTEELEAAGSDEPYYWRVKAVDFASNESKWSDVRSFYVWEFPLWTILVIAISASVAIAVGVSRKVWKR